MNSCWVVMLLACAGCNLVFGVEPPPPPPDASTPTCATDLQQIELPVIADTYLEATAPDVAHGTDPILRLDPDRSVLLKFAKGNTELRTITFEVPYAPMASGCSSGGATCEVCPPPVAGMPRLSFIKPTWNEREATQLDRSLGTPWDQAGARGAEELALACADPSVTPQAITCVAPVPPTVEVAEAISIVLRVGPGGGGAFAAREGQTCGGPPIRAVATCRVGNCGNGTPEGEEGCDDGNDVNGDGCDNNCTLSSCGNGIVSSPEQCDDGNTLSGDGCDFNCTPTGCGNNVTTAEEECDDGNSNPTDGCDNSCMFCQVNCV